MTLRKSNEESYLLHYLATIIVSCYSPDNANDEIDIIIFCYELSSLVLHIPKPNVLIIGGDMNAQTGREESKKVNVLNSSNGNEEYLSLEKGLAWLNKTSLWAVRYTSLLKEYLPTTESIWIYAKKQVKATYHDWSSFSNRNISHKYMVLKRNKFDILQEISETYTPNDECEHFVTAHIEATEECIPTKPRAKCRVPWELIVGKTG